MPNQLKIYVWFISFLLFSNFGQAQQMKPDTNSIRMKKSEKTVQKDKKRKAKPFFERDIKFGWDVSNLFVGALSPTRSGADFSVETTFKQNASAILEFGRNQYATQSDAMDYSSSGNYFRLGVDFDMNSNENRISRDIFYLGLRYAFASFDQKIENFQITSSYWPTVSQTSAQFRNQAHWIESMAGFKVEVLKNVFLGLGLRFKALILQSGDQTIKPAPYIPGYGKTGGTIVVGFNYNLYFNLPLNYSKKTPKNGR